jgi:hypothetical protein
MYVYPLSQIFVTMRISAHTYIVNVVLQAPLDAWARPRLVAGSCLLAQTTEGSPFTAWTPLVLVSSCQHILAEIIQRMHNFTSTSSSVSSAVAEGRLLS